MYQADLFKGKRFLVTGGGTGLGRSMSEMFLSLGGDVVICGRRGPVLDDAASEMMQAHSGNVTTYSLDIRDAQAVDAMVDDIFVTQPLDGLVNNAAGNFISPTEALSPRGFDAIANIVFHGTFYVTQAVGKRWIDSCRASGGYNPGDAMKSVMSIVTTWVETGSPYVVPSAMSKAGISVMTQSLAVEWAKYGIRLNCVGPGEIPTEGMNKRLNPGEKPGERSSKVNPHGRVGEMAELQNLTAFLMSNGCDWLTGQKIHMDGASYLASGASFYELREWTDQQWMDARAAIESQNDKDRKQR
jgi:NAD(P)-dependent dehydrogenase (short-subunit alcohol dehydrogenase family)